MVSILFAYVHGFVCLRVRESTKEREHERESTKERERDDDDCIIVGYTLPSAGKIQEQL